MENIETIASLLATSSDLAMETKSHLKSLEQPMVTSMFAIVSKNRKLRNLNALKEKLSDLYSSYFKTAFKIKQYLKEEQFFQALQLSNSVKIQQDSQFSALRDIEETASRRRNKIFSKLKDKLRQLAQAFDPILYEHVLLAYTASLDVNVNHTIQGEFVNLIQELTKQALEKASGTHAETINSSICLLNSNQIPLGFQKILESLTNLLYNHHLISRWHEESDFKENSFAVTKELLESEEEVQKAIDFYSEVKKDLLRNRKHIWTHMQRQVGEVIDRAKQINFLKQKEVYQILKWLNTFIEIGEDFSGSSSQELKKAIRDRCEDFLNIFHDRCWTSLSQLLDREQWTRIPAKFSVHKASFLSKLNITFPVLEALTDNYEEHDFSFSSLALGNPFEKGIKLEEPLNIDMSGIEELISNTGSHLLKCAGKYNQLSKVFSPLAFDVFVKLSQLIDYFFYSVFSKLSNENSKLSLFEEVDPKVDLEIIVDKKAFQNKFSNLKDYLFKARETIDSSSKQTINFAEEFVDSTGCHGYPQSVVAIESLRNIVNTVKQAESGMKHLLSDSQFNYFLSFFSRYEKLIEELDLFLSESYMGKLVKIDWVLGTVQSSKWDDTRAEISPYVNRIFHLFNDLKERMQAMAGGSIPSSLHALYLTRSADFSVKTFVSAFSAVKKCNAKGRMQMKTDLTALIQGLSAIVQEDLDFSDYIEYLDIWNESPEDIQNWVTSHSNLPLSMHKALMLTAPKIQSLNKTAKNSLIATAEVAYKRIHNIT